MTALAAFPGSPVLFLNANNVDGYDNELVPHGSSVPSWKDQGSGATDFVVVTPGGNGNGTVERMSPLMKRDDNEEGVSFDGSYNILNGTGSKTSLKFFHTTGIFDLLLVLRRRAVTPYYANTPGSISRRVFGGMVGTAGQKGMIVALTDGYVEDGNVGVQLLGDAGEIVNFTSGIGTDLASYTKILIRGTGTELKITRDFYHWDVSPFLFAPAGTANATNDYALAGSIPTEAYPLLMQADYGLVAAWSSILSATQLDQLRDCCIAQFGEGV